MKFHHIPFLPIPVFLLLIMWTGQLKGQTSPGTILILQVDSTRQTVEGFGASLAFYEGWLNAHPKREEIYEAVFGELSLDILRIRNAYDYDPDMVGRVQEYVEASEQVRGNPIPVYTVSWSPPGYLKNTGDRNNGGTLRYTVEEGEVRFDYAGFAQWWRKSLDEYNAHGIYPAYLSIQNEPGWSAFYETCLLNPTELVDGTDTIAGYNKALDAVYDTLLTRPQRPAILGPESIGIGYNNVERYVDALDIDKLDGLSHHLYHGVDENDPFASTDFSKVGKYHPELPHFQTEYDRGDWFSLAGLLYKSFHDEEVVAYLYWDLIWGESGGLVTLEFPWDPSRWTDPAKGYIKTKDFYAFKQFSAFIHPGWKRTSLELSGDDGVALGFVSPTGDSAACVLVNRSETDSLPVRMGLPGYRIHESAIYTTSESDNCLPKGALIDSVLVMAPHSIATVDMRITPYNPEDDTVAPSVPQHLQLIEAASTSLSFSWDPSTDSVGVSGYRIYVDGTPVDSTFYTHYKVSGLMPETGYELAVSAYDEAGNESESSQPIMAFTTFVPDTVPPAVEVSDTVYGNETTIVEVTSSEPGMVYLVTDGTGKEIDLIREASLDSVTVEVGIPVMIDISALLNGTYMLYAADTVLNISDPASLVILGVGIRTIEWDGLRSYPNPFITSTTLRFHLFEGQPMNLSVYDSQGHEVRRFPLGLLPSGEHTVQIQREGLEHGLYLFKLENEQGEGFSGRWIIQD